MKLLNVGDIGGEAFTLPLKMATEASAILAMRGTGKSNTGVVFAEEMYDAGIPWCAIDPKGDWYGIRSAADGTGPGLPIPVFGGLFGDLPLVPDAGAFMAELIIEQNLTCVLDVSDFTQGEQARFLTAFGNAYYQAARRKPAVRHLFLEEADEFLPQQVPADMARCVGIWTKIVKLGRRHGIGVTLITQRSATLNKNALSQIETLIALRTSHALDKAAIKGWLDVPEAKDILAGLSTLKNGQAWVISPHGLGLIACATFRRRRTFDTGATPEVGVAVQAPSLGQIDLGAIETRMAELVEQATADDPKTLKARIKELEGQLAKGAGAVETREVIREVEVEVEPAWLQPLLEDLLAASEVTRQALDRHDDRIRKATTTPKSASTAPTPPPVQETRAAPAESAPPPSRPVPAGTAAAWPGGLQEGHKRILTVLALYGPTDLKRLALMARFSPGTGHFNNLLGRLRSLGLMNRGTPADLTDEGRAAIPANLPPLPTGQELIDYWVDFVGESRSKLLQAAIDAHPNTFASPTDLAEASGFTAGTGHFNNLLGRLRSLGLLVGKNRQPIGLAPAFAEAIGKVP